MDFRYVGDLTTFRDYWAICVDVLIEYFTPLSIAVEGANFDYTVPSGSRSFTIDDATVPASIQTLIRVDRIALEEPEDFTMTLMGGNNAARAALNAVGPNQFSISTIRVVIKDNEGIQCE